MEKVYQRRAKVVGISMKKEEEQEFGWAPETPEKLPAPRSQQHVDGRSELNMKLGVQETVSDNPTQAKYIAGEERKDFDESGHMLLYSAGRIDVNKSIDDLQDVVPYVSGDDNFQDDLCRASCFVEEEQALNYAGRESVCSASCADGEVLNGWDEELKDIPFVELLNMSGSTPTTLQSSGHIRSQIDMSAEIFSSISSNVSNCLAPSSGEYDHLCGDDTSYKLQELQGDILDQQKDVGSFQENGKSENVERCSQYNSHPTASAVTLSPDRPPDDSIDLKKKQRTRPKRKKHKPKVVVEGKQRSTPKPRTPKPATPRKAKNQPGKRKYVRKSIPAGKIHSQEKSHTNRANKKLVSLQARNSCKRALDFDSASELGVENAQNKRVQPLVPIGCEYNSLQMYQKKWREQLKFPKMCKKMRFKRRRKLHFFFWSESMVVTTYKWCNIDGTRTRSIRSKRKPAIKFTSRKARNEIAEIGTSALNLGEDIPPSEESEEHHWTSCSLGKRTSEREGFGATCSQILKDIIAQRPIENPLELEEHRESCLAISVPREVLNEATMNFIIQKFQSLRINEGGKQSRKKAAKVNLDPETLRVWNLLDDSDNKELVIVEKEEPWQKEREIFKLRIKRFNAINFLVQGDRGFRKWKGSVIDSVVGVFLTQNVADHLSSSAFMSLAAAFPLKTACRSNTASDNQEIVSSQESVESNMVPVLLTHDLEGNQYFVSEPEPETSQELQEKTETVASRIAEALQIEDVTGSDRSTNMGRASVSNSPPKFEESLVFFMDENQDRESLNTETESVTKKRKRVEKPKEKEHDSLAIERKAKKKKVKKERDDVFWENLQKKYSTGGLRLADQMDSVDWEAVRAAPVEELAKAIKERGQQFQIAIRIKNFLHRLVQVHDGNIELEWLRNVPSDLTKEYLLKIHGLGLKSVECVRLLSLQQVAFPVDTNVGRIAVRLGWVPLQPLPKELPLHLLEEYPAQDSIQKYLWPRLCTLDQQTLYELHYQMITFGKVFCTKRNPNCNACPLRGDCRHFASALASEKFALPGPADNRIVTTARHGFNADHQPMASSSRTPLSLETSSCVECRCQTKSCEPTIEEPFISASTRCSGCRYQTKNCEPIIEEPIELPLQEPEAEVKIVEEPEIEYDSEGIPIIKLNVEKFQANLLNYMDKNGMMVQGVETSRALVGLTPEEASIPVRKLKYVSRLRTEHQVYELPKNHYLLRELQLEELDPDDPLQYHLAIWQPGETVHSLEPPTKRCNSNDSELCNDHTCFSCNNIREQDASIVRATILIPSRTANKGSFPLNGTYFQVNEVFADHETSYHPINVPRDMIYNLKTRTAYFGTSISAILRGLHTREIQKCFWKGIVCVRAFDREQRCPRPLVKRFHCSPSKMEKKKRKQREK